MTDKQTEIIEGLKKDLGFPQKEGWYNGKDSDGNLVRLSEKTIKEKTLDYWIVTLLNDAYVDAEKRMLTHVMDNVIALFAEYGEDSLALVMLKDLKQRLLKVYNQLVKPKI